MKIRHRDYLSLHLSNNLKNSEILETTSRERGDYSFFKQVQDYSSPHLLTNAVTTLTNSKHKHLTGKSTSSRKYFWTTLIIMRRLEIHLSTFYNNCPSIIKCRGTNFKNVEGILLMPGQCQFEKYIGRIKANL